MAERPRKAERPTVNYALSHSRVRGPASITFTLPVGSDPTLEDMQAVLPDLLVIRREGLGFRLTAAEGKVCTADQLFQFFVGLASHYGWARRHIG